jgi:4-carboxymuconolactone decarboxylase
MFRPDRERSQRSGSTAHGFPAITHPSGDSGMSDYKARYKRGFDLLKKMGREELMLEQKALYPEMYEISVGHLFGDVWARPGLSLRERQLVTLAANIALCRPTGNYSHYRSAMHIGITKREICELIIQVGHYAGWPTLSNAVRQFTAVLKEDEKIRKAKKKGRKLRSKLV